MAFPTFLDIPEDRKVRHLGISFHSSARLLDRVLTEHPEIEFVQIAVNPIDWDSELVQAELCYDVILAQDGRIPGVERFGRSFSHRLRCFHQETGGLP